MSIDDAYANAAFIPGAAAFPPRWASSSQELRHRLLGQGRADLGLSYGAGPRTALDLFHPAQPARGLVVFVHGGYWKQFGREDWSFLAEGALAAGWAVAIPSYDLCPDVRISDISRQIAAAIAMAADQVAGDVILAGHSAGGHLVARVVCDALLPAAILARVRHVMPISPVADLRPLLGASMNLDLRLDQAEAAAESPVLKPAPACSVTVWVGAQERPAFLDQARWLAQAWGCAHIIEPQRHHFNVIDGLAQPDSALMRCLLGKTGATPR